MFKLIYKFHFPPICSICSNQPRNTRVTVENKMVRFSGSPCSDGDMDADAGLIAIWRTTASANTTVSWHFLVKDDIRWQVNIHSQELIVDWRFSLTALTYDRTDRPSNPSWVLQKRLTRSEQFRLRWQGHFGLKLEYSQSQQYKIYRQK